MAEEIQANGQDQVELILQKVYLKDASFEAPNAPAIFQQIGETEEQPQVQLNLGHKATKLDETSREVVLTLTLTCMLGDQTAYLAEVHQAGIFGMAGFSAEDEENIIGSYCPNVLFPFARQTIASMIQDGGFPPFLLQPINFDALFAEQQRRQAAGEAAPTLNS
ncbi:MULTISPECIES: protein-export chaperone SecB [Oleiagrimonas]|uniref:Protein-export protein SecB n=1 Tax=Oleiagrimonas citrea TaxID=1665687 RepID=A0A846ZP85_9GAMM|nr:MULTISPECIES: protein-export chaperone SecB [Oleiagrimonas]NKZ40024.1 protein-export chaperone SecB [Oleiagrimonas citrea]RAP57162.1 protein-export chaperone SecB [Oleiagrimonas sp. MCCC 1A03011]